MVDQESRFFATSVVDYILFLAVSNPGWTTDHGPLTTDDGPRTTDHGQRLVNSASLWYNPISDSTAKRVLYRRDRRVRRAIFILLRKTFASFAFFAVSFCSRLVLTPPRKGEKWQHCTAISGSPSGFKGRRE